MPENENMDLTEELVVPVEKVKEALEEKKERIKYYEEPPKMEVPKPTRSAMDLMDVQYEEMTEDEKKYFISALKMRNQELDNIVKSAFEENRKLRSTNNSNLKLMEDTLTFIKTSIGNCYGAVSLAIKNMEREVK